MRPTSFTIKQRHSGSSARAGVLHTPHGDIKTPAFVAVATKANIKGVDVTQFSDLGIQTVIANTYHLYLSGLEAIEKAGPPGQGGLGAFMGWSGPTMTDSGGFQVFSLGAGFEKKVSKVSLDEDENSFFRRDEREPYSSKKNFPLHLSGEKHFPVPAVYDEDLATSHGKLAIVDDEGVSFTSHLDGSLHRFTPERSIELQHRLGADIIFAFDECTSPEAQYEYQKEAMDRTHRWALRSLKAHRGNIKKNNEQGIYGIVQGGRFADLRIESAKTIAQMDFDGFGIGGSFSKQDILGILDQVNRELPEEKPRHLLGIGEPEDLFIGVAAGIDTFDCVLPTRNGRTGGIYTKAGKIQIPNAEYREDFKALDEGCECPVCSIDSSGKPRHTRAYVHHLFRTHEMLGPILASMHNLYFLTTLACRIRESILDGTFVRYQQEFLGRYKKSLY